ncbi:unnamed protein product [Miscanthus lutarioriparius]|uniref:Uncharacterized protein n=1 Tax=Miscanthus lutarioriparius TaxID=422564 RepID=A0A811MVU3_9POAL|nr:unnamed protein product [Miscanthus lutarioriparius]
MDVLSWFGQASVVVSVLAVCWTMIWQNLQHIHLQRFFARNFNRRARRLAAVVDPYLSVTFEGYEGRRIKSSEAFDEIKSYLTTASTRDVRHLRAESGGGGRRDAAATDKDKLVFSMAKGEEVADAFRGATVWWSAGAVLPPNDTMPWSRAARAERRFFRLEFHEGYRDLVLNEYLPFYRDVWTHVPFEHPKTFDKLAMDPAKKKEIIDDLDMFKKSKDYYARVGKPWKRGYLLYGPPGTGKSTMVAAMANHLEPTPTSGSCSSRPRASPSWCSRTSTARSTPRPDRQAQEQGGGRRGRRRPCCGEKEAGGRRQEQQGNPVRPARLHRRHLVGVRRGAAHCVHHQPRRQAGPGADPDGADGQEVEMSYCDYESFKFLARMHLRDDVVEAHEAQCGRVRALLEVVNMVPVDVGEHLTPRSPDEFEDAGPCLDWLVTALEKAKEEGGRLPGPQAQPLVNGNP